jgi:hypothetical protein
VPRRAAISFEVSPFGDARSISMTYLEKSDIHRSPPECAYRRKWLVRQAATAVNRGDDARFASARDAGYLA